MRAYQVFARMTPARCTEVMRSLQEKAPAIVEQAVVAASAALKARPVYLRRKSFEQRAEAVRRALARVAANELAEEVLAAYFLECRKELLVEWLDSLGVEHEDGGLTEAAPSEPPAAKLRACVDGFRKGEPSDDRELLLQAFAAQSAIDWPELDSLLAAG